MSQIFITSNSENHHVIDVYYGEELKGTFDARYERDEFRTLVDQLFMQRDKELERVNESTSV